MKDYVVLLACVLMGGRWLKELLTFWMLHPLVTLRTSCWLPYWSWGVRWSASRSVSWVWVAVWLEVWELKSELYWKWTWEWNLLWLRDALCSDISSIWRDLLFYIHRFHASLRPRSSAPSLNFAVRINSLSLCGRTGRHSTLYEQKISTQCSLRTLSSEQRASNLSICAAYTAYYLSSREFHTGRNNSTQCSLCTLPREPRTSTISICAAHTVCILLHEHSLWAGSLNEMLVAHFSLRTESLACLNRSAHWAFLTELLLERGIARESCCWVATPASSVEDNSLPCKIGEHLSALTCATSRNYEAWNHLRFLGHINHYMYMYRNELGVTPCFGAFDCRTKLAFKSPATLKNATMLRSAKTLSPSNGYSDEGAWRKVVSREIARL